MSELFEIKITEYKEFSKLPDPFLKQDGTRYENPDEWEEMRKNLYKPTIEFQYGKQPPCPEFLEVEPTYTPGKARGGNTYLIHSGTKEKPIRFRLKLFLPNTEEKCPVVIDGDGCFEYPYNREFLDKFLDNNIAFALFDRTEIAHDVQGEGRCKGAFYETYNDYNYGAFAAWAWGYSRVVDALEVIDKTDNSLITFTGHSRGGKTAMLAGALDERAAIVNPNETCAGACSCNRLFIKAIGEDGVERPSETAASLAKMFPFWMGEEFNEMAETPELLPFDSHFLKAMVAPRVLFVSEAGSDIWANPVGSWQTTKAAQEVYKFLGKEENLYWYFRNGTHYHAIEDVEKLVSVIKKVKYGEPLCDGFFKTPFKEPPLMYDWKNPLDK
ncbi:MAG: hypothetical protein E7565_02510 [Ruminococcaceae bacterium]|nr:hypothetical protein [Oscillospiraceae bacterium]